MWCPLHSLCVGSVKPVTVARSSLLHVNVETFLSLSSVHLQDMSDAIALKNVVMAAVENWQLACYVFSSTSEYFIMSVGLNTHKVRSPLPFPTMYAA